MKVLKERISFMHDQGMEYHVPLPMIPNYAPIKPDDTPEPSLAVAVYQFEATRKLQRAPIDYVYKLKGVRIS